MSKFNIISMLALYVLVSHLALAKEVYINKAGNEEYLFLGSLDGQKKKYLAIKENKVSWISNNDIKQQTNQLTPSEFYKKITKSSLIFKAEGSEPFWNAILTSNKLILSLAGEKEQMFPITVVVDKNPLDNVFVLMFESKDKKTYGIIRMLSHDTRCDISIVDEASVFEIFINNKGKIFKGCSRLDLAS